MKYYAVYKGRVPGIYDNWNDCHEQVNKFTGAKFKGFKVIEDAEQFMKGGSMEVINERNIKSNILTNQLNNLTDTNLKSKNKYLTYIYYYNYPGFLRPNFQQNKWRNYYYIFTDGSYRNRPELQFKSGYGVFIYNSSYNISVRSNLTHNYCEVTAIEKSLDLIYKIHIEEDEDNDLKRQYIIVSDSQYAIKSLTQYMHSWKEFGWKRPSGKEIHYTDKWKYMYDVLYKLDEMEISVGFMHVKSHMTKPVDVNSFDYYLWYGNKCADCLAVGKSIPKYKIGFDPTLISK